MAAPEDSLAGIGASLRRVRLVAWQTATEALRLRVTVLVAAAGAALVLLPVWLREFNFGAAEGAFIAEFGLGLIGLLGSFLAATGMAHLYFRDVEGGLAALVLTRALRRGEYLAGKLAGVSALLALFVVSLVLLLAAVLAVRASLRADGFAALPFLLQAGALAWFKLTLVAAMTLFVCSYAGSELFAACAGLMLAVIGHLRPFTRVDGWLSWLRAWPNLGLFDAERALTAGGLAGLVAYWALFMALFGTLAAYVFRRREL